MAPQALPERVVSPPCPRQACGPRRSAGPPRPWPTLPAETQKQIARAVAELIRRRQAGSGPAGRETTHVDGLGRR
jgi:hypothetical protein